MRKALVYLLPLAIFLIVSVFLLRGLWLNPREVPSPFIDKPATPFSLAQLAQPDAKFSPADMKGQVWLLNVWASWCVSCRVEHPLLVELSKAKIVPIFGLNYKDEQAHRARALSPDHPYIRGTAQNPDVYFQGRETVNTFYNACPGIVQKAMDKFANLTGRAYKLFDYLGAADAENVIIIMGSGAETAGETALYLDKKGQKVGVVKVRLYRPFSNEDLLKAIPATVKKIAVLNRTKEPGAAGEPLYLDVVNALAEGGRQQVKVIGGRYGLSSKEFTPAMVKTVFDQRRKDAAPCPSINLKTKFQKSPKPPMSIRRQQSSGTLR